MKHNTDDFFRFVGSLHGKLVKSVKLELAITVNLRGLGYGG